MYGSTTDVQLQPLLSPPVTTPQQRADRRKLLAAQKKDKKKSNTNVFSQVFRESTTRTNHTEHSFIYNMLNPRSREWEAVLFKRFIATVIVVDMCIFVLSTEPGYEDHWIFDVSEGVASTIFLIEYLLRLSVVTERRRYAKLGPILGRLRYMVSASALVDLLATLPFFLEVFTGIPLPTLTYIRVFRLLRISKTEGYAKATNAVTRVLYYNRQILTVAALVCVFLVLLTAVVMYYLRPKNVNEFRSIPATMYMTTLMLTGQGGPDPTDLPWYTKGVILATSVFSVAMFAIPASMLTWGFEAEAERLAAKARRRTQRRLQGLSESSSCDTTSDFSEWSSSSLNSSDEEYQKIIAGGGEEEDGDDEDAQAAMIRELMETFQNADADGSNTLSQQEFVELVMGTLNRYSPSSSRKLTGSSATAGLVSSTPPPSGGGQHPPSVDPAMVSRITKLEAKVDATHAKLDRLLRLMEKR